MYLPKITKFDVRGTVEPKLCDMFKDDTGYSTIAAIAPRAFSPELVRIEFTREGLEYAWIPLIIFKHYYAFDKQLNCWVQILSDSYGC